MNLEQELHRINKIMDKMYASSLVRSAINCHRTSAETKILADTRRVINGTDFSKYDIVVASVEMPEATDGIVRRIKASVRDIDLEQFDNVVGKLIAIKLKGR